MNAQHTSRAPVAREWGTMGIVALGILLAVLI
jgi:hypothetical protein